MYSDFFDPSTMHPTECVRLYTLTNRRKIVKHCCLHATTRLINGERKGSWLEELARDRWFKDIGLSSKSTRSLLFPRIPFFFPRNLPRFRTSEKRVLMQNDPAFDYWTVPICSVSVVASVVACIRNQKVPSEFWRVSSMFRFVTLRWLIRSDRRTLVSF